MDSRASEQISYEKKESLTRDRSRIVLTDTKIINKNCKKKKGELVVSPEHKVYVSKNYLGDRILFSPINVNPASLPDSTDCLAIMPEPKSTLMAFSGLPNEMYKTSASSSYSHDDLSGFSINFSIVSFYFSECLRNKQSGQNHLSEIALCKQLKNICSQLQESCRTSLLQEEIQHLLAEQNQECLESLRFCLHYLALQDDSCKYVPNVLLSTLLEHHSLKMQASFDYVNNYELYKDFGLKKYISSLMQNKARGLDSSERDCIDEKGGRDSEKSLTSNRSSSDKNRSHNVLISSITNINIRGGVDSRASEQINNRKENKKCYLKTWKYFWELNGDEKVLTLNAETGEKEWQLPYEKQEFEHNEEMYSVKTIDSDGKEGELVVSKEHKVYASVNNVSELARGALNSKDLFCPPGTCQRRLSRLDQDTENYNIKDYLNVYFNPSNLIKSSVVNISISDCSLKAGSSDQIGVLLSANDKAKYGSSLVSSPCGDILLASNKNSEYDSSPNILNLLCNTDNENIKLEPSILEYFNILFLLSDSSLITKYGEISLHPLTNNSSIICLLVEPGLKKENAIEASTISSSGIFDENIFYEQHFLASLCFNSSANLMQSSSVNLLSLNKSLTMANSNLITNCSITLAKANSNLSFNSAGISTLTQISSILNLDINNKELYKSFGYDNFSSSERNYIDDEESESSRRKTEASQSSMSSRISLSATNTNGKIMGGRLVDNKKLVENFDLKVITDVYKDFSEGEEVYFLDGDSNAVKVKSIEKIPYSGKIYDVDVKNDIILVERCRKKIY